MVYNLLTNLASSLSTSTTLSSTPCKKGRMSTKKTMSTSDSVLIESSVSTPIGRSNDTPTGNSVNVHIIVADSTIHCDIKDGNDGVNSATSSVS